jgi:two-component system, OmpR family, sensor kinase
MSLHLRLALWYGALTGLVVLVVSLLTYAAHTRGHYDDVDYTLQTTGEHMAEEFNAGASLPQAPPGGLAVTSQSLAVRIYDPSGQVAAESAAAAEAPAVDPLAVLAAPSGPAFDPVAALGPPMTALNPGLGAFGLVTAPDGARWRIYVLPFHEGTGSGHTLVIATSLAHLDSSIAQFRWLVAVFVVLASALTLLAGWLLASRALRPVAALTDTAGEIERLRGFNRRVPVGRAHDELGKLATTFNNMLASLEQAYRAQQRFVSDASHELRAPLTAIQGNLDLLKRVPDMPPDQRQEAVEEASREAHRLARLVADLLALARADAGGGGVAARHEPVELDRVLLEALGDARHLTRGQRLSVADLEPTQVVGNADRLKQLFLILLDNAIKYTPPDGNVSAALRRNGAAVVAEVRDNGIGITGEALPYVFDRFYRADPARSRDPGGTGLGLPIARWIAEEHSGSIKLDSAPGVGTTVTLRLPVLADGRPVVDGDGVRAHGEARSEARFH